MTDVASLSPACAKYTDFLRRRLYIFAIGDISTPLLSFILGADSRSSAAARFADDGSFAPFSSRILRFAAMPPHAFLISAFTLDDTAFDAAAGAPH